MDFTIYAYQISPGSDESLYFAQSLEECQAAALRQRTELKDCDPELGDLGAMAIYRCTLRVPSDAATMLAVLNGDMTLFNACVVDRRLVALVAE
jgi:hypothetical protein